MSRTVLLRLGIVVSLTCTCIALLCFFKEALRKINKRYADKRSVATMTHPGTNAGNQNIINSMVFFQVPLGGFRGLQYFVKPLYSKALK